MVLNDDSSAAAVEVGLGETIWLTPSAHGAESALASIAATIGPLPPLLLRDTDPAADSSLVQPGSTEMPARFEGKSRYQLLGEIARGGMGAVLKGRDVDIGRDLAVKVLLETHRHQPEMTRRFVEEAQISGQLQHPGIVPVYELGAFADGRPFFTMKLVKGRTLAALLRERETPRAEISRFLGIFEQVCQTTAYSHARGVIHRDLKPSNIMVGAFGKVQVMDWGLAKVLKEGGVIDDRAAGRLREEEQTLIQTARGDSDLSSAGSVLGTPAYMSPEQARGERDLVNERADVFALGSILCEILSGQPAFQGRSAGEIQRKAARGDLGDAHSRLDSCQADPDLIALAKACLAAERDDRPRDAKIVADAVKTYRDGVEDRLRRAELERAQAETRAQEEAKRRILADRLVFEERKRRRATLATAATLLISVSAFAGVSFFIFRQRADRIRHNTEAVQIALVEAGGLEGRARRSDVEKPFRLVARRGRRRERRTIVARQGRTRDETSRRGDGGSHPPRTRRGRAQGRRRQTRSPLDRLARSHSRLPRRRV